MLFQMMKKKTNDRLGLTAETVMHVDDWKAF